MAERLPQKSGVQVLQCGKDPDRRFQDVTELDSHGLLDLASGYIMRAIWTSTYRGSGDFRLVWRHEGTRRARGTCGHARRHSGGLALSGARGSGSSAGLKSARRDCGHGHGGADGVTAEKRTPLVAGRIRSHLPHRPHYPARCRDPRRFEQGTGLAFPAQSGAGRSGSSDNPRHGNRRTPGGRDPAAYQLWV